ncbi:hypothetical protein BKA56DRAFT_675873 [Ilyonectria sp. MPI-CAGE-AT-0026]|nr:hypothetical protein BKA56DRAFT_675873 [Ilyonectria sp. MPI-CAGE-AT-0026]
MASSFILTSAPLLLSQIGLASFIPDISQPYADAKRPYTVSPSEYSDQPDTNFHGLVQASSESLMKVLATRFAGLVVQRESGTTFRVDADQGSLYTLNNPADLFEAILGSLQHGEGVKRALEQWKRRGLAPRFVVGYRTFIDARLARAEAAGHGGSATATAPVGTALGDPTGTIDLTVAAGHRSDSAAQGRTTAPGERIYSIAYRRVRVSTRRGTITATLDQKTKWEPFSGARGEGVEGDVYYEACVAGDDEQEEEGCEVFTLGPAAGEGGETVRIGVLADDGDSDEEDEEEDENEDGDRDSDANAQ